VKRKTPRKPRRSKRSPRSPETTKKPAPEDLLVLSALDGVQDLVRNELEKRFGRYTTILNHPRTDEIHFKFSGSPNRLLSLKTAQTLSVRRDFPVSRPRTLLSPEHVATVDELIHRATEIGGVASKKGFRFDAAGSDSPTMLRLADKLEEQLGIRFNPRSGDCVIGLRPGDGSWEVLCRVGNRPLATRSWRRVNYRGSLNAPIAACMVELARPKRGDRYLNIMAGSGTLLIERLMRMPTRVAVGVDSSEKAVEACRENTEAAGLKGHIQIVKADARKLEFPDESFDVITTDLPYGEHLGDRESNVLLYREALLEAERLCRPGGKMIILSQDIASLTTILPEFTPRWKLLDERRIVQRDFRPMCVSLRKNA
jgi:tRNA (guanine6-N2)-methyltransferase